MARRAARFTGGAGRAILLALLFLAGPGQAPADAGRPPLSARQPKAINPHYLRRTFLDACPSADLVRWTKHGNHREVCIDEVRFNPDGTIQPVPITFEGVRSRRVEDR